MTGTVLDFAGITAPSGWLLCFGKAVSRTAYANLFAKIGTTYRASHANNNTQPTIVFNKIIKI